MAVNTKRRWWYLVGVGVIALWMPRWIQIPVLVSLAGALRGIGDLLPTKRDRFDNTLAWLFFKAALWYELFVWLYPISNALVSRWHFRSWVEFVISAIGVTVVWQLTTLLFSWAVVGIFAAMRPRMLRR